MYTSNANNLEFGS